MAGITPEIQAQLDEQKKQCVFCKIISGEISAKKVYEDKLMTAILDINPAVSGHTILIPNEHYPIMQFLPRETFGHVFGLLPRIAGAVKKAMLAFGATVFIANGGAAGQQAPHFLIHILPREEGDGLDYSFDSKKKIDDKKAVQAYSTVSQKISSMMQSYISQSLSLRNANAGFKAADKSRQTVYEDEKIVCAIPEKPQCIGHLVIYLKDSGKNFEDSETEIAVHLFSAALISASAVFETLGAEGTNMILNTGKCGSKGNEKLAVHVFPRFNGDGLELLWKPSKPAQNLEEIQARIRDKTFLIEHEQKPKSKKEVIDFDAGTIIINENNRHKNEPNPKKYDTDYEIIRAISEIKHN